MFIVFIVCLICVHQCVSTVMTQYKRHQECDLWAHDHGECVNNPRFMWTACLGSCIQYTRNTHQQCDQWAAEGECTNNPAFIQIHCPKSCGNAMVWSPWVRNKFALEHIDIDLAAGADRLAHPNDIFEASEIMRERLVKYFDGLYSVVPGLSSNAPSEYLGMLGLAEAFLYCFRLHEVLYKQFNLPLQIEVHYKKVNVIIETIRIGYTPDRLMLALPMWMGILNESALLITNVLKEIAAQGEVNIAAIAAFDRVSDYYLGNVSLPPAYRGGKSVRLANGVSVPLLGLGTWQLNGDTCYEAVISALKHGHRLIDSAEAYGNEVEVGQAVADAIKQGVVTREQVFVATKVSDERNMGYDAVKQLVTAQLERLQVDYIDLYMLHSPVQDKKKQADTWKALEELYEAGTIRALGVSNFDVPELEHLVAAANVVPHVVQNKLDVYHVGKQLDERGDKILQYVREKGIVMMAYSPFSAFPFVMQPGEDPIVKYLANKKSQDWGAPVSPQQLLLKWIVQKGYIALPRSVSQQHHEDNSKIFDFPDLAEIEMKMIDSIQLLVSSPVSVPVVDAQPLEEQEVTEAVAAVTDEDL